jgi:1,4-dihydroxy-2-naphthoyl-CoA hydrolase
MAATLTQSFTVRPSAFSKKLPEQHLGGFEMDLLTRLTKEPLPFATLLGIEIVSATLDKVVAQMLVRNELCTRPAVLHGGAIMAFADTLGALGTLANLTERDRTATIESKTNFISGAPVGSQIVGETTPLHRGQRTMVWRTRITTADDKLVAVVTQTQLVFPQLP